MRNELDLAEGFHLVEQDTTIPHTTFTRWIEQHLVLPRDQFIAEMFGCLQVLPDEDADELAYLINVDPDEVRAAHRHAVTADAQSQACMDQHGLSGLDTHLDALSAQL